MEEIQPKTQMAIDVSASSCFVRLLSAFHAMEPPDVLISFAREVGGGSIKEEVQRFIWEHCISPSEGNGEYHRTYLKRFLKKLIAEIESNGYDVLDELYEQYAFYMTSLKDEEFYKGNSRVVKRISFLFSDECSQLSSCPNSKKLEISLQCSLNMLEGDTGLVQVLVWLAYVWPM